jgi:hypothetical protein
MTADQFKILLEKIRNNLNQTEFKNDSSNKIKEMKSTFPNGTIQIELFYNDFNVEITPKGEHATYGKLELGKKKWLSMSWWRWRKLCYTAEKEYNKNIKKDKENSKMWEAENVDRAIIQTFPEILEDEIFGED